MTNADEEVDEVRAMVIKEIEIAEGAGMSSDSGVTRSPEKSNGHGESGSTTMSSDEIGIELGPFGLPIETRSDEDTTESQDKSLMAVHAQKVALGLHEWNTLLSKQLTDQEREQAFKWANRADVKYLGFVPSEGDKRKFLKAMALVHGQPEGITGCYLPVSSTQRWAIAGFSMVCVFIVAGVAFYLIQEGMNSSSA